jgi:transposase
MHMTVISGSERRRRWSAAEREEIVLASFAPGAVIAEVARQFDVSTSLIYKWRRDAQQSTAMFVPAVTAEDEGSVVPDVPGVCLQIVRRSGWTWPEGRR